MRLFGRIVARIKAAVGVTTFPASLRTGGGIFGMIREGITGTWQRHQVESIENVTAFAAVYSCLSLITRDVGKLRIKLVEWSGGIWTEVVLNSPYAAVLRKPNKYQTRIQFIEAWIASKLLHGNTYIYKERADLRGLVTALHVLNPRLVVPLVTPEGDVYYQLSVDTLSGLQVAATVPASEIIHDRMLCLWHPLVGVSPIYACGSSATQGIRIQTNSAKFFENMSRPSGQLTAPGSIDPETAKRLKETFEAGFAAGNIGRLFVAGDGLKYEAMSIPAQDAQLIEQLRWTVEDVARCFHVPLHKLGMGQPTLNNVAALNLDYYAQTLQTLIESIELLLDEGLGLTDVPGKVYGTELDLDGLLRMDPLAMAEQIDKEMKAGTLKPDEARARRNLPPVPGGNTPYMQVQNYSLAALAKRDARDDPFSPVAPVPAALPAPAAVGDVANDDAVREAAALIERITKGLACDTSN